MIIIVVVVIVVVVVVVVFFVGILKQCIIISSVGTLISHQAILCV